MDRRKVVLKPIVISDADRQFLDSVLASNKSPFVKNLMVKKIVSGYCAPCGAIATQKAVFDAHGATLIEKYCDNCVKEMKFRG